MNNAGKKVIPADTLMAPSLRKFISASWFFEHRRRRVGPQADLRWDPRVTDSGLWTTGTADAGAHAISLVLSVQQPVFMLTQMRS